MNKLVILLFLTGVGLVSTKWAVKTGSAKISFTLPNEGKSGTMNGLEADIDFDPVNPAASVISAKVAVNSLVTNNSGMTAHLLNADFFDEPKYPHITFVSSSIAKTDSGFVAKGDLTMKGKTRNVEIPFIFLNNDTASVFKGTMKIYCGDFGLMSNKENNPASQADITIEVPVFKK